MKKCGYGFIVSLITIIAVLLTSDVKAQRLANFEIIGDLQFQFHTSDDLSRGGGGGELQVKYWMDKHFALAGALGYMAYDVEIEAISNKRGDRYQVIFGDVEDGEVAYVDAIGNVDLIPVGFSFTYAPYVTETYRIMFDVGARYAQVDSESTLSYFGTEDRHDLEEGDPNVYDYSVDMDDLVLGSAGVKISYLLGDNFWLHGGVSYQIGRADMISKIIFTDEYRERTGTAVRGYSSDIDLSGAFFNVGISYHF